MSRRNSGYFVSHPVSSIGYIFALRVLPNLDWRNVNVSRPCEMAIFDICTSEKNRIAQLSPVRLIEIRGTVKDSCATAVKNDRNPVIVDDPRLFQCLILNHFASPLNFEERRILPMQQFPIRIQFFLMANDPCLHHILLIFREILRPRKQFA